MDRSSATKPVTGGRALFGRLFAAAGSAPRLVLLGALLLGLLGAALAATSLGVRTATDDLISERVAYRRNAIALYQAFPQLDDPALVVLRGDGAPEAQENIAARLRQSGLFASVYAPGSEAFFRANGLLYLPLDELEALADRLAEAQPLLGALSQDPSLRGLNGLLLDTVSALDTGQVTDAAQLIAPLERLAAVIAAHSEGQRDAVFAWQDVLSAGDLAEGLATRRFVVARTEAAQRSAALDLLQALEAPEGTSLALTGKPVLERLERRTVAQGATLAGVLSLIAVALLLYLGLRRARLIFAVILALGLGLAVTLGYAALSVGHLNLISVTFIVLFIGLSVDFGIHLALRYREAQRAGLGNIEALRACGDIGPGLCLSALCAALAFFAFAPTDYRGLAELGIIAGGSMVVALVMNGALVPALAAWRQPRGADTRDTAVRGEASDIPPAPQSADGWLGRLTGTRWSLIGIGALTLLAASALPQLRFDLDPLNLQAPDAAPVRAFRDLAQDPQTSPYFANVLADDLDAAQDIAERLRALPEVAQVLSVLSFVPNDQDDKLFVLDDTALYLLPSLQALDDPAAAPSAGELAASLAELRAALAANTPPAEVDPALREALADLRASLDAFAAYRDGLDEEVAAQALRALDRAAINDLPAQLRRLRDGLSGFAAVSSETLPDSLRARWLAADGTARLEVRPALDLTEKANVARFAQAVLAVAPNASGLPITLQGGEQAVTGAFVQAVTITALGIVVLLALVLRSVTGVALTVAPLLAAAVLTLGSAAALGVSLNFANIIVLPLLLGLGVASSVHMVSRWQGGGAVSPLATSTGRAVLFSALTTLASFGSLAVSPHRGMASMGVLLFIAIAWMLLVTLVALPALLRLVRRPAEPF